MEVDYTEKLNFSDDEENQAAKDKGENWLAFFFFLIYSFTHLLYPAFTFCVLHLHHTSVSQYWQNLN